MCPARGTDSIFYVILESLKKNESAQRAGHSRPKWIKSILPSMERGPKDRVTREELVPGLQHAEPPRLFLDRSKKEWPFFGCIRAGSEGTLWAGSRCWAGASESRGICRPCTQIQTAGSGGLGQDWCNCVLVRAAGRGPATRQVQTRESEAIDDTRV